MCVLVHFKRLLWLTGGRPHQCLLESRRWAIMCSRLGAGVRFHDGIDWGNHFTPAHDCCHGYAASWLRHREWRLFFPRPVLYLKPPFISNEAQLIFYAGTCLRGVERERSESLFHTAVKIPTLSFLFLPRKHVILVTLTWLIHLQRIDILENSMCKSCSIEAELWMKVELEYFWPHWNDVPASEVDQ